MTTPRRIELHIGRLVVDADALGRESPEHLQAQLHTALAQALSTGLPPAAPASTNLGERIAGAVVPQLPGAARHG